MSLFFPYRFSSLAEDLTDAFDRHFDEGPLRFHYLACVAERMIGPRVVTAAPRIHTW